MDVKEHLRKRREASMHLDLTNSEEAPSAQKMPFETVEDGTVAIRLALQSKAGEVWSYPYATMGLVHMKSPESLVIFGGCGRIESIIIGGRGLEEISRLINQQRLSLLCESDNVAFSEEPTIVSAIKILLF